MDTNGRRRHVYCEMEQVCGSSGWMRVAYLNMTDPSEECPRGFRLYNQNGVKACGRPASSSGGCQSSVQFPTYGVPYSEVCGRVTGYQYSMQPMPSTLQLWEYILTMLMELASHMGLLVSIFGPLLLVYKRICCMEVVAILVRVLQAVFRPRLHL